MNGNECYSRMHRPRRESEFKIRTFEIRLFNWIKILGKSEFGCIGAR